MDGRTNVMTVTGGGILQCAHFRRRWSLSPQHQHRPPAWASVTAAANPLGPEPTITASYCVSRSYGQYTLTCPANGARHGSANIRSYEWRNYARRCWPPPTDAPVHQGGLQLDRLPHHPKIDRQFAGVFFQSHPPDVCNTPNRARSRTTDRRRGMLTLHCRRATRYPHGH